MYIQVYKRNQAALGYIVQIHGTIIIFTVTALPRFFTIFHTFKQLGSELRVRQFEIFLSVHNFYFFLLSVEYKFMFYVDTFVFPAVFLDSFTCLEYLLFAVLVLDGRHTKFLTDFQRNEKCFGHKSFHCLLSLSFILFAA
nr:MAG TPA: hypothetical protein [Caudoviricetes sp.]